MGIPLLETLIVLYEILTTYLQLFITTIFSHPQIMRNITTKLAEFINTYLLNVNKKYHYQTIALFSYL